MAENRIILVEDDNTIAENVALNLRYVGYDCIHFDDGGKAAEYIEKDHGFDLALLDIMLPGKDGFELLEYMKKYNIPVIYMTAKTDSGSEVQGLRSGAEDYIVKPFEMVTLLVRIEKVLERFGRLNRIYRFDDIVPVWDFYGSVTAHTEDENYKQYVYEGPRYETLLSINAIDGTLIDRELGY